jgi:hypothetical protein
MSRTRGATAVTCAALCALLGGLAHAAEYVWQISGSRAVLKTGAAFDADTTSLAATHYFTPVDDERGPLSVAAFLNRSSHLAIEGFNNDERQQLNFNTLLGGQNLLVQTDTLDGYSLGGRYVWRGSGWFAGGGVESGDGERRVGAASPSTSELRGFRAVAGKYLGASTSLEFSLRTAEMTTESVASAVCALLQCITEIEITTEEIALSAFHVGDVGAMTYSFGGAISSSDATLVFHQAAPPSRPSTPSFPFPGGFTAVPLPNVTNAPLTEYTVYSVAGELFPLDRLGIHVGYVRWQDDPIRDDGYDVAATWFFWPRVAARFGFERRVRPALSSSLRDTDTVTFAVLGRF